MGRRKKRGADSESVEKIKGKCENLLSKAKRLAFEKDPKDVGRKGYFDNVFRDLNLDHGRIGAHFFKKGREMTEGDKVYEEFYTKLYFLLLERIPITVRWNLKNNPFEYDSIKDQVTCGWAVRFNWKKATTMSNMPVNVRVEHGRTRIVVPVDLAKWIKNKNDRARDIRKIAGEMRTGRIVDMTDPRSLRIQGRRLLRIREVLGALAADLAKHEKHLRVALGHRSEWESVQKRKEDSPYHRSNRYVGGDGLWDGREDERSAPGERSWWDRPVEEMTLGDFHRLVERRDKEDLNQRFRETYGRCPHDTAELEQAYRSEWKDIVRQEEYLKFMLRELKDRFAEKGEMESWDEMHARHVKNAHEERFYRAAVRQKIMTEEQRDQILADYPDIAVRYAKQSARKKGAWDLAGDLVREGRLRDRPRWFDCDEYDGAFLAKDVDRLSKLLTDPLTKGLREVFILETGLELPQSKEGVKSALGQWSVKARKHQPKGPRF